MLTSSHVPKLSSHHPREYDESYIAPSPMELYQRTRDQEQQQQQQQNANVQQQNRLYLTSSPINNIHNDVHYSQQHIENTSRRPDGYHADDDRDYDQGRYDYEHQSMGATFPPYQMRNDGIVARSIRSEPSPQIVNYHPQQQHHQQPQYHHRLQVSDNENIYNRNESTLNKVYYENRSPYDGELEQHEYSSTTNDGHGGRVVSSTPQYYSNLQNEYEIYDRQQQQNRNPINDGTTNRRSSEYTMMQQQQQQQQYHFRENVKHEYRDPPPPPISTTPDLYFNNDPLSPLSIPWCGDGPVVDNNNNNNSGKRSPQDSEAVCLGSFVDCGNSPRYERSDSYDLKGRYGYHPHKYDYQTSTNNGRTNREGVMMQHPYNNNYANTIKNQHYHQYDDRDAASIYVVPREVICSTNDDPVLPPPQLLPPPSRKVFERRDDVSGSSTIITPSTFANNPHHQPQNQQQRHRGDIPPPLAVHEQYSTRNRNDHNPLSPIAHNIPPQQQQQQQQQHHQWKNTLSHPAATARQQQYSTRNDQSTYREQYLRSHHAQDIPTPNTQTVPSSINSKPPLHIGHHGQQHQQKQQQQQHQLQYSRLTVVAAEKERRKSKARHQILKEISQATIMRNSSLNDTDRKFWDSQIDTLNQSFKKL